MKAIESLKQACRRIQQGLIAYRHQTEIAAKLVWEAKTKRVWMEDYSSWSEFCERGCGYSRQWADQLFKKYQTKVQIEILETGKIEACSKSMPSVKSLDTSKAINKGILPKSAFKNLISPSVVDGVKKTAKSGPCAEFGDGTYRGVETSEFYVERDPADKMPKATPEDVVSARAAASPPEITLSVFPHPFTVIVEDQEEEDFMTICSEKLLAKRNKKNGHPKINMQDAIAKVKSAYKRVKGKQMAVKPMDAGQLRRHLEDGMELDELIAVGEKAWVSNEFWSKGQSHQLSTFVKHFGTIRNEVTQETEKQQAAKSVNPQNYL